MIAGCPESGEGRYDDEKNTEVVGQEERHDLNDGLSQEQADGPRQCKFQIG